jgi:DNA invertase Pin-like site-specific DNA recombinase
LARPIDRPIAATYSRVSKPNDARDASLDTQEEAQVALWEKLGYAVPREYRLRERYTGMESIYDRPILNQLRDLVASGRVQGVSAYDTDRLARDPNELLTVVRDNIKRRVETKFVQCDHAIEGRIGEMILYMKGFASALEYDAIRDRTMRGRRKILEEGQWVGGGKPKYGLVFVKDERGKVAEGRRRVANPETAPVVRRIFDLVAAGTSASQVAAILNDEGVPPPYAYAGHAGAGRRWLPARISAIIRDRTYIGEPAVRQWVRVDGRFPGGTPRFKRRPAHEHVRLTASNTETLVSRELFERANAVLDGLRKNPGRPARDERFLLRGVLHCGVCGYRLTPVSARKAVLLRSGGRYQWRAYRCFSYRARPEAGCRADLGARWVEEEAWRLLADAILHPGRLERLFDEELRRLEKEDGTGRMAADLKRAEDRRKKVERSVKQLVDDLAEEESRRTREALKEKIASLGREADELDRYIVGLRLKMEARGERRRAAESTLGLLDAMREAVRRGVDDAKERRKFIEATGARFVAWKDGHRVRLELPVGLCCENSDASTR